MVEDIQNYDQNIDSKMRSAGTARSGLTDAVDYKEPKTIFDDDYIVLD